MRYKNSDRINSFINRPSTNTASKAMEGVLKALSD